MWNPYIFTDKDSEKDWRAFEGAGIVTDVSKGRGQIKLPAKYKYSEGLSSCELKSGIKMQATHVAISEGDPGQHLIYRSSEDSGVTWSEWKDVEPEGPPMSPYGSFVQHPSTRRTYFVYMLGPAPVVPDLPDGRPYKGPVHRHHIGKTAIRLVHKDGSMDEKRHIMQLPETAIDRENIYKGKHRFFYGAPKPLRILGNDGLGWLTKLGPRPLVYTGEAFLVLFKNWATNDRLEELEIELLPKGDHGIRDSESACISEFGPIHIDGQNLYFKYRTKAGYAGLAESHDGGKTFTTGPMRYALDNDPVKNPQGPLRTFTDAQGRIWLTWYNMGYCRNLDWDGRNLVFIAPIRISNGKLRVGQGELATYRKDQKGFSGDLRMNCLGFKERNGNFWLCETSNKHGIRTTRVPAKFTDFLANQFDISMIPEQGMLMHAQDAEKTITAPDLNAAEGATFMFTIPSGLPAGVVLLDGIDKNGAGVQIKTGKERDLVCRFGDGRQQAELHSDPGRLDTDNPEHHIALILDGHAALASMVINGRLQDGGKRSLRGVTFYRHEMKSISGKPAWSVHESVKDLRVYNRFLLTTEVMGAWRKSRQYAK